VFDHPYFATTDDKGQYTIDTKGLPDGTYTVQAWQEVYHDSQPQQVEVKGGKASKSVTSSIRRSGEDRGGSAEAGSRGGDRDADVWCGCLLHR